MGVIITYAVSDSAGNAAAVVTRTVNVVDTTKPVITLTGNSEVTHEAATTYNDQGATASDTYDGVDLSVTSSGSVNVNSVGDYTITYAATDFAGNSATVVTRKVTVVDTTKTCNYPSRRELG